MNSPLKAEYDYYLAHQEDLLRDYKGRVIVLKGQRVIGVYDDEKTALFETQKTEPLGTFLVQKVEPGTTAYTVTFHSRVA